MKRSRRYNEQAEGYEKHKEYSLDEGVDLMKKMATAKFDESVEVALALGVDPRKADQMVRGTCSLPHGTGKEIRVLVITKAAKEAEAKEAGADYVGHEDIVKKIQGGWLDFDVVVATPDVMGDVGKLGKVLGPRGLMPNPKSGTVTMDVGEAVKAVKAGRIDFRVEKAGILHAAVGKASFEAPAIRDNIKTFVETVVRMKPATSKGQYIKSVHVSSTMGPGITIDKVSLLNELLG